MSSISVNTEIDIELSESEKEHLIQSYRILRQMVDNLYDENLEDTDEVFFKVAEVVNSMYMFFKAFKIDFEE